MTGERTPRLPKPESYFCAVGADGSRYGGQRTLDLARTVGRYVEGIGVAIVGYAKFESSWTWVAVAQEGNDDRA